MDRPRFTECTARTLNCIDAKIISSFAISETNMKWPASFIYPGCMIYHPPVFMASPLRHAKQKYAPPPCKTFFRSQGSPCTPGSWTWTALCRRYGPRASMKPGTRTCSSRWRCKRSPIPTMCSLCGYTSLPSRLHSRRLEIRGRGIFQDG